MAPDTKKSGPLVPGSRRILVWFRTDLRVADNTALWHACEDRAAEVIALFVLTPDEWTRHDVAPVRIEFILRTLRELAQSLERIGIPLRVITSPSAAQTPELVVATAASLGCAAIFANREHEVNEGRRDARVQSLGVARGIETQLFTDQVSLEPSSVRTGEGRFYTVFTPFKKAWTKLLVAQGGPHCYPVPGKRPRVAMASDPVPDRVEGFASTVDPAIWPAGEQAALKRMRAFISAHIRSYKTGRDFPARNETSTLSPYLAVGAISPRTCIAAAMEANDGSRSPLETGNEHVLCWISELCWREFFVHVLVGFPRVCMGRAFQPLTERVKWNVNPAHLEAWKQGRTGVPIVDAGMRQLLRTGWMHNRVRMITAMFLSKNLFLEWREGERHFMRSLVDGFFASNNGGWQWSASTGTDAAPYFRIFNPTSQGQKFDPDGEYVRTFVPELAGVKGADVHDLASMPPLARARIDYPEPIVDLSASRARAIEVFQQLRELPG
jgi:deoxyribodipyrimidine photo-lyase